ncbi:phage tail protein [Scytonema hofmannii PCC 7110]|uniref:Phage tail protein n=1 Tax=Scytonema hofmannii PCC 7110 TaxID=128403 RepID=A0A139WUI3_9CYAN|nr:phage tail protein [Scytonema hofmannii]KYC36100.1 phage tail protein [Scytonema hofmannii PCC 7110]
MSPYAAFNFLVEIHSVVTMRGLVVGGFSEVSGLQAETEVEDYREGGVNHFVHRLPKVTKFPNLVLKRGITDSFELWVWHQRVIAGQIERHNGSVILLDNTYTAKWRWNFFDAYPVKWVGPDLKADGNAVAIETLELAHNGLWKP